MLSTVLAHLRNAWRGLTSMRTALVLLFLLALAALPGALIPQRSLNPNEVQQYFRDYPALAPILDKLGFFEVFSSVWFASIYVLLFISLVGCLVPRLLEYYRQLRGKPVRTPRNLARMPHHASTTVDASVDEVMAGAHQRLRGWRRQETEEDDGARSISAERGFLREAGNLLFHFALVGLLVCFGGGKLVGYEGQVVVLANGSSFCNSGIYNYDSFNAGPTVDGTKLSPFCVQVNNFHVDYLHTGQPEKFRADLRYQSGADLENNRWRPYALEVNSPLRTAGDRIYLTGNGYAPTFTVTFPDGQRRTSTVQWQAMDQTTMLSQGATKFDRPGVEDPVQRRQSQIGITGLFAPTASFDGSLLSSRFPDTLDPRVAVDVLRGDLGLDSGGSQSIFEIDRSKERTGQLDRVARENMAIGDQIRLDDGTTVRFDGVERYINLTVSHDPLQLPLLGFAIAVIFGITASLTIKRRRVWVRAVPVPGDDGTRTKVEIGGLARTDQAGYGEEFTVLAEDLLGTNQDDAPTVTSARGRKS